MDSKYSRATLTACPRSIEPMSKIILFPLSALASGLMSCATVSKVGNSSLAFVKKTTSVTTAKVSELSDRAVSLVSPAGVKVVEVRESDLKELPSGEEKAMAYESNRKRSFWFFDGPVDFKEPSLPQAGGESDGSLLPPKTP